MASARAACESLSHHRTGAPLCATCVQATIFGSLDRMEMTVWEALAMLNELREYEAVLMAEAGEAQVGKRLAWATYR